MNKNTCVILSGLLCGTVGGFIGYFIAKKKYRALAEKEIKSVKEHMKFVEEYVTMSRDCEEDVDIITTDDKTEYTKHALKYAPDNTTETPLRKPTSMIYLITEDEFNESDVSFQTLQYYEGDGVVADMDDNCIRNFRELLGSDDEWVRKLLTNQDGVFIRNEIQEMDFAINLCQGKWANVASPSQRATLLSEVNPDNENDDE